MTDFVTPQSAAIGSIPAVPNALATGELNTAILVDPVKIQAYAESIASQMNDQSGGPRIEDLSERIADITVETSAQGSSILTVGIVDPLWVLPMSGFIQVDQDGFLWPPVDINFPTGTDCVWRLCQYHAVWDADSGSEANLTLTFEDRIVSLLREMSPQNGIAQGQPNQTLGGFFKQLVDNANQVLKCNPKIQLVELISPGDPNYTPPIDYTPASAQSPLRQNPAKAKQGLTTAQQAQLKQIQQAVAQLFGGDPSTGGGSKSITIRGTEPYAGQLANTSATDPNSGSYVPNASYVPGVDTNP